MDERIQKIYFDKWLSGYTGTCSDNHTLYQAFCAGYEAAQQSVQADGACAHEWTSIAQDETVLVCMLCGQETPRR